MAKIGRPLGAVNKTSVDVRVLAMRGSERAIMTLIKLMDNEAEQSSVRLAAANAILDRAHGKPSQHVTADVTSVTHEQALAAIANRAGLVLEAQALVAIEDDSERTLQ